MPTDQRAQLAIFVRAACVNAPQWRLWLAYLVLRAGRSRPS